MISRCRVPFGAAVVAMVATVAALGALAAVAVPVRLKPPSVLPGEIPRDISPCPCVPTPPKEKP